MTKEDLKDIDMRRGHDAALSVAMRTRDPQLVEFVQSLHKPKSKPRGVIKHPPDSGMQLSNLRFMQSR